MTRTVSPARHRPLAALATAAVVGALLSPTLAGPAAAAECDTSLPYRAYANSDLLRLSALDLPGVNLGPVVDVRLASSGASMDAQSNVASAAAARDVVANLLGLDLTGLVPVGEVGHTVYQEAPPSNDAPATGGGPRLDLGVARAEVAPTSAHARWSESMRCADATGVAGTSSAAMVDAAVLPSLGGRSLVWLPDALSSQSEAGLTEQDGTVASYSTATVSLSEIRLFAGSSSEITVKVISRPSLTVSTTGAPDGTQVRYDSPVLEISGPGIDRQRLDAPGTHLDLVLAPSGGLGLTGLPIVGDVLGNLLGDTNLSGLDASGEMTGPALPTPEQVLDPDRLGGLPLLRDVLASTGDLLDLSQLSVLRLSLGDLRKQVDDDTVSATAASLRLQVLRWGDDDPAEPAQAVLDLGVGLLQAAASAPAPQSAPPPSDSGNGGGLPVTGSAAGLIAGLGILLAVAGRFLFVLSRSHLRAGRAG